MYVGEKTVGDDKYTFSAKVADGAIAFECAPPRPALDALCAVVSSAYSHPERLMRAIEEKTGMTFEGYLGFDYAHGEGGKVNLFVGKQELAVDQEYFAAFARAFAAAFREAERQLRSPGRYSSKA